MRSVIPPRSGLRPVDALLGGSLAIALHAVAAWFLINRPATTEPQPPRVIEVSLLSAPSPPARAPQPTPAPSPTPVESPTVIRKPVRPVAQKPARDEPTRSRAAPAKATATPATPAAPPTSTVEAVAASFAPTAAAPATTAGAVPEVTAPRFDAAYLNNPAPAYPPLSRRLDEQGRVLIRVFVDPNGAPAEVELRESSGYRRLDAAAEAAVRRWRFVPARRGQEPVGAWVLVPIAFNLRS
ncbi:MAG: energy transducer TonB [Pseudomonadota bacterium]